jgi:histidinol-phosphate aminotransferase
MTERSIVRDDHIRSVNGTDMSKAPGGPPLDVATMFNGYVGAHVVYALDRLGVWERLLEGPASVTTLCARDNADRTKLRALLDSATILGHVEIRDEIVSLAPGSHDLIRNRGFFTWAVGGYNEVLREMPALTTGHKRWGQEVRRDEAMVAAGAADVGRALMTSAEADVLDGLDYTSVADVGCGDGSRLIRLCGQEQPLRGIGIDISEPACALAAKRVADAGLTDHVRITCQNIFEPGSQAVFPGVDLVSSFLMLHDLFAAYRDGVEVMRALRHAFPDARYFLLADTNAHPWQRHTGQLPVFSLQFELVHAFMNVPIRPKELYEDAFVKAGLTIERCEPLGVPSTWLYLLRVPAADVA